MVSTNALVKVMARTKKIKIQLSEESINNAINQIRFMRDMLQTNITLFVKMLQTEGLTVGNAILQTVPKEYKDKCQIYATNVQRLGDTYTATIVLEGSQALFIEFSAGITYGTNTFPSMPNNPSYGSGYGMGTFPGQGHWDDPKGWFYKDESGNWVHSFGTKANAPMYHADDAMRNVLYEAAKFAFGR